MGNSWGISLLDVPIYKIHGASDDIPYKAIPENTMRYIDKLRLG